MTIAIILPFREANGQQRAEQLTSFVEHMKTFIFKGAPDNYRIYVIEQSVDERLFNRGALLNAGYTIASADRDYNAYIFHDVDLLPSQELAPFYTRAPPAGTAFHIAGVWKRYCGATFFGGAVSFTSADFEATNGFPNTYWGWGGEDDELRDRTRENRIRITRPLTGSMVDLENLSLKEKLEQLKAGGLKNKDKRKQRAVRRSALRDGLSSLDYSVLARDDGAQFIHIVVELNK